MMDYSKLVVVYFSGTGNSRFIAEHFAENMGCGCYSIEDSVDFDGIIGGADTIGVVYPIYGSCVPRIMREFVGKYKVAFSDKKLIIFCTQMMFSGDGAKAFTRLLPGCADRVIYAEHFSMPNNICNFFLFPMTEKERVKKPKKALKSLEVVCENIRNGVVKKRGWNFFSVLLGKSQSVAFPKIEKKQRGSFVADGDCVQCGLCVRECPMNNLELSSNGVSEKNNCTLCYRCVNICPTKAVTVYVRKKVKRQYKGVN